MLRVFPEGLFSDPISFQIAVDRIARRYKSMGVTHVVACETRGFIFGAPVALALRAAFVRETFAFLIFA